MMFNKEVYEMMKMELESPDIGGEVNIDVDEKDFENFIDNSDILVDWDYAYDKDLRVSEFYVIEGGMFKDGRKTVLVLEEELYDTSYEIEEYYEGSLKSYLEDHDIYLEGDDDY